MDDDGANEVVVALKILDGTWVTEVKILSGDGTEENAMVAASTPSYGTAPALADFDGDG